MNILSLIWVIQLFQILGGDHHSDEVTEESAVSEAAEKLLGFELPVTNTTHNENESTQIRYDTRFSLI